MNLTVLTPPPFEPVTMLEVYRQLRLTPDHVGSPGEETHPDDLMISAQIQAAREYVEVATRRALVQQRLRLSMEGFPCGHRRAWLYRPPLIRVERVQFYDTDNALQTISAADWYVTDDLVPELRFVQGFAAPQVYCRPDAVRIEYVAGYTPSGSPSDEQADFVGNIPQTLKQCVLIGVQIQYDNLSDDDRRSMERIRESMLQTYRVQHL